MEAGQRAGVRPGMRMAGPGTEAVRRCLAAAGPLALQNILMRIPDKVCAVALASLPDEERESALSHVAPIKAERVREEMRLEARRRTTSLVHGRIVRAFLSYFGSAKPSHGPVWIRPKKR